MRVLHLVSCMSPEYGGPATVARGLTAALVQQGVHCEIITTRGPTDGLPVPGVKVHCFDTEFPAPFWPTYSRSMKRFLDAQAGRFDLIYACELMSYMTWAAFRASRKHALPFVLRVTGGLGIPALRIKKFRKWIYRRMLLDDILNSADALQAISQGEAARIAELGYKAPTFVIPHGVSLDAAGPSARSEFLASCPMLDGKRVILFLGRLHRVKGVDVLARCFATVAGTFPDAVLLVAGPDDGARDGMRSILGEAGVLDRTVFTGMLTGDRKLAAFQCADLFVLPSYGDGFSNAVLEAMASGLPVVISEQCNFPEVAEHGAGFVVPLDDTSVCEAIGKLLSDPRLGARMGGNGRKLVKERYTWQAAATSMVACYRALLHKGS